MSTPASSSVVLADRPAPHVLRLLINRPDKRNSIDFDVRQALLDALRAARIDGTTRAVVFGGVGGMFSAGGDLATMSGLTEDQARARMQHIHILCRLVGGLGLPVVSVVEGAGAGAAIGLALLGDHIVMGEGARILFPFLKLGLTPDWGQLLTLPRRVGLPAARRILCAGKPVGAAEALRIGLVDTVVPDAQAMETAVAEAASLAQQPLEAFARMKQRLNRISTSLDEELIREENDQAVCLLTDEFNEGFDAFKNKRNPDFTQLAGAKR
ncbi:MAG: enoyl-CoA hydratase-related protein [Burkholderiales bacterium]